MCLDHFAFNMLVQGSFVGVRPCFRFTGVFK
jgi:hypothetical protein